MDSPNYTANWARTIPAGTAILAGCDEWAALLVLACQITGIAVPEELAVIGVDDDGLRCEMCQPHLSSVRGFLGRKSGRLWPGRSIAFSKLINVQIRCSHYHQLES